MGLDARRSSDAQATRVPRDDQNTLRRRIGHRLHHRRIGRSGSDPVSPGRFQEPDCASNEAWGDPWWIEEGEWTQLDGGFNDVRRACRPTAAPTPSLCMPCRAATVQSRPPPPSVPGRDFYFAVDADSSRSARHGPKDRSARRRPHDLDPNLPAGPLQSGRPANPRPSCFYEAAVDDLTDPARSGLSLRRPKAIAKCRQSTAKRMRWLPEPNASTSPSS
jgi:hypothetical protein